MAHTRGAFTLGQSGTWHEQPLRKPLQLQEPAGGDRVLDSGLVMAEESEDYERVNFQFGPDRAGGRHQQLAGGVIHAGDRGASPTKTYNPL